MICKCCHRVVIGRFTQGDFQNLFDGQIKDIVKSYHKFDEELIIKYDRLNDEVIYKGSKIKR